MDNRDAPVDMTLNVPPSPSIPSPGSENGSDLSKSPAFSWVASPNPSSFPPSASDRPKMDHYVPVPRLSLPDDIEQSVHDMRASVNSVQRVQPATASMSSTGSVNEPPSPGHFANTSNYPARGDSLSLFPPSRVRTPTTALDRARAHAAVSPVSPAPPRGSTPPSRSRGSLPPPGPPPSGPPPAVPSPSIASSNTSAPPPHSRVASLASSIYSEQDSETARSLSRLSFSSSVVATPRASSSPPHRSHPTADSSLSSTSSPSNKDTPTPTHNNDINDERIPRPSPFHTSAPSVSTSAVFNTSGTHGPRISELYDAYYRRSQQLPEPSKRPKELLVSTIEEVPRPLPSPWGRTLPGMAM
ncbi:hypothetical protein LTR16_002038 [Cryomyces antarcticus]|uniref:Uncharacterized protein n=1 Tax=Cryomyces antarcticus TaxID=329879 RepID=A0ABR0LQ09_9PEZI|nr:hypothetical protein LTR16_002038 [Cryomyces antarcticus]